MSHGDASGPGASAAPEDLRVALLARASLLVFALLLVPWRGAAAQEPGTLLPDVTSEHDPARGYALYIPSGYDPARPAPVLFVMDPRGRAREALELFRAGAERHGWIVMSSRDTRSDTAVDPNELALEAMLQDAQARFAVHERRLYVAGFSGTARAAWEFAGRIPEHAGGVIGFGAAPAPLRVAGAPELPLYLGVGRLDFNFHEVRGIERLLDRMEEGPPHRVAYFPGTHGWGPPALAAEAIDWMELQAMRRGLRPLDPAWLRTYADGQLARGEALEAADRPEEALALYRALARDLSGLVEADEVRARARRLEDAGQAAARERRLDELTERAGVLRVRLEDAVARLMSEDPLPEAAELRSLLKIDSLRAEAADLRAGDGEALAAGNQAPGTERRADPGAEEAARVLETIHVRLSFYAPRDLLAGNRPGAALVALRLAEAAKPGTARVCRFWALALARIGAEEEGARETPGLLRCAAGSGGGSAGAGIPLPLPCAAGQPGPHPGVRHVSNSSTRLSAHD